MRPTDNVIDFTHYRKRRQARVMAEQMWAMYAARATLPAFSVLTSGPSSETRQA